MALLRLAKDIPGVDYIEYRDTDYYNKYEYRARFNLVGVRYTWYIKSDIQELIDRLEAPAVGYNYNRISCERDEVRENLPKLEKFLQWRNVIKQKKNCTVRIEHNTVAVFSNDLQELHDISNVIPDIELDYTQVEKSTFIGIKYFARKPKHNYRVYLKSRRVEDSFALDLHEMFKKNKKLYPCPSLKQWTKGSVLISNNQVSWRYRFSSANHFIDYDDESILSYLALVHGNMLGKRYKLEKRPDPV
jgi:hypothetical protein